VTPASPPAKPAAADLKRMQSRQKSLVLALTLRTLRVHFFFVNSIKRRMRNVSPDFGACLTLFAAGFVRPDNGLSSRLEISDPQEKQGKRNERALRIYSKKKLIFQNNAFYPPATSLNFSSVGFRRIPAKVFQGTPFR
jgi:hypothetical protein